MRRPSLLLVLLTGLLLRGCDLLIEDEPLPFPWVQDGARLVYDFHPVADTSVGDSVRRGVYTLSLAESEEGGHLEFRADIPLEFSNNQLAPYTAGELALRRESEGLYSAELACLKMYPEETRFMLRVPAKPEKLLKMPREACRAEMGFHMVMDEDTTVTVAAGTFNTFMVQYRNYKFISREFWSERSGLIKIEWFRDHGETLRASYELASKSS